MARTVAIGAQDFGAMRERGSFYVDKTGFVREWWNSDDAATLVCRPRRFGKTLALSTVDHFLSIRFAGRGEELFGGLDVWGDAAMRELQGTVPVVMVSFADVKRPTLEGALAVMKPALAAAVRDHGYLAGSAAVPGDDLAFLARVSDDMDDATATTCLKRLCAMLLAHHGVRPVVLLDEYDAPMQEAWLRGYWDGMSAFMRSLMNSTFKTNPALGRGLMTGVARVASESIFPGLNNLRVVTTTTSTYEASFGFTQAEVDAALDEFGRSPERDAVREWYDGFTFGEVSGVYNPWSITCYLKERSLAPHWVNTSSNGLVSSLVRRGDEGLKADFEELLAGGSVAKRIDERVDFRRLHADPGAAWSLLLAAGYLRVAARSRDPGADSDDLLLALTNREVRAGFDGMVREWFGGGSYAYGRFTSALLAGDAESATLYLGDVTRACMSSFDAAGGGPGGRGEPERFYHGLVLGLLVELRGRYAVESNRESGYGRYDVMLVPNDGPDAAGGSDPAVVIEFKALGPGALQDDLAAAVVAARAQIAERAYVASLSERGIGAGRVLEYGIAFSGKRVLVG